LIQFAHAQSCWRIGAFGGLVLSLLTAASLAVAGEYENGRYVPSIFRQNDAPRPAPVIRLDLPPAAYVPPDAAASADTVAPTDGYRDGLYIADKRYLLSYPRTLWRMTSAPARFDGTDWLVAGGVAAAAGAFFAFDEDIRDIWQNHIRSGTTEDVAKFFDPFGDAKIGLGVLLAAYGVAETLDQTGAGRWRREKAAALLSLESLAISNGIVFGIKFASGRERPGDASSSFDFDGPGNGTNTNTSFPSGHAASAFAIASTLSEVYGDDHAWVPWVLYPIAAATALTRVDRDKHWASDTFVGAAIGYFVGKTVARYNPFLEKHNMAVVPSADDGQYSLSLVHRFQRVSPPRERLHSRR
jgi:membrane-associated phospholipid phosphatase